jgi:hypothetical protein
MSTPNVVLMGLNPPYEEDNGINAIELWMGDAPEDETGRNILVLDIVVNRVENAQTYLIPKYAFREATWEGLCAVEELHIFDRDDCMFYPRLMRDEEKVDYRTVHSAWTVYPSPREDDENTYDEEDDYEPEVEEAERE